MPPYTTLPNDMTLRPTLGRRGSNSRHVQVISPCPETSRLSQIPHRWPVGGIPPPHPSHILTKGVQISRHRGPFNRGVLLVCKVHQECLPMAEPVLWQSPCYDRARANAAAQCARSLARSLGRACRYWRRAQSGIACRTLRVYAFSDNGGKAFHRADGTPLKTPPTVSPAPEHNADIWEPRYQAVGAGLTPIRPRCALLQLAHQYAFRCKNPLNTP
jgi:hypothetical protein